MGEAERDEILWSCKSCASALYLSIFLPITTYSLPQLFSFVLISSFLQVIGGGGREGGGDHDHDHGLRDPSSCGYWTDKQTDEIGVVGGVWKWNSRDVRSVDGASKGCLTGFEGTKQALISKSWTCCSWYFTSAQQPKMSPLWTQEHNLFVSLWKQTNRWNHCKKKREQQHEHKLLQSYSSQDKKLFYAMLCYAASLMRLLVFIVSAMFRLTCSPKFMTKLWLANGNH